ncbi:PTS sugar transporter subunit IIA [Pasteurellaceae bacterium 15-036681]|nr:PTS sugar transporter subunit IIA [Pasteurellaceae bacterium 15-036681]
MILTEFLPFENIHCDVDASSKKRVLELVGYYIAEYFNKNEASQLNENKGVCPIDCFSLLFKREKLGSTSINNGVALPHAKLAECECSTIEKPVAVFLRLEKGVDYEAQDNRDVDLIYAVLFPEQSCERYKGALQKIAQQLNDKTLLKQLRAAEDSQAIWSILQQSDEHNLEQTETLVS